MKNVKRGLALLLCLVMVLSYVPVHGHAAGGATNVSMAVDKTQVEAGDTVTVTLSHTTMTVASFSAGISFDKDLFECVTVEGPMASMGAAYASYFYLTNANALPMFAMVMATAVSTPAEANSNGNVGFAVAGTADVTYTGQLIFTVTFMAKADGEAAFTLYEDSAGTDGYKNDSITTTNVTIGSSEPECEHTNTKLVPNDDGTHNIVCTNTECGETVTANVPCTGTDDGDHTSAVECACGNTVTAGTDHKDENPKDHICDVDGCDYAMGEHVSNAAHPCLAGKCEYCGVDMPATAQHSDSNESTDKDHNCDICGTLLNEGHTEGEPVVTTNPATCTEEGSKTTETFCTECGEKLSSNTEPIPAGTGCVLGAPAYDWADDYSKCTVEVKCQNGTVHETETVNTTWQTTTEGTCKTPKVVTYYADFKNFEDKSIPVTGEKDMTNHAGEQKAVPYGEGATMRSTYHAIICDECEAELGYAPHVANTDGYCECGMYTVVHDFNGGKITTKSPIEGMDDEAWAATVEAMFGGFDVTSITEFIDGNYDPDDIATMNLMIVKEGYQIVCEAYDAEGTQPYNGEPITKPTTLYYIWESTHTCAHDHYKITPDTHQSFCSCEQPIGEAEPHNFNNDAHTCVCDAKFTGWDGKVYYLEAVMLKGWNLIDGAWYYLDLETGVRAEGLTRVPYPTEEINGITYAPDAETLAYCESKGIEFIDATEAWFQFDEDGKFVYDSLGITEHGGSIAKLVNGMLAWHPGLVVIPGSNDYFYFIGDVVNGGNIAANGDTYITRSNGIEGFAKGDVYNFVNGELSGANGVKDGKYYLNSRLMMGYGLVKTDKGLIYVRSNGYLATGKYYISNTANFGSNEFYGCGITFDADGYALEGIVDGKYYVNGLVAYSAGVVEVEDGKYIYVRSNGQLVKNTTYWITNVGDTGVAAKAYVFDENGYFTPEFVDNQKNGIVEENGVLYYYENGNIAYGAGLLKLSDENGEFYIYVRSNGQLATGKYWPTTTNGIDVKGFLNFGTDGKCYI